MADAICCVRNCGRRPKSTSEFCERCWLQLTDGERAQYMFSRHAPFWPTWRRWIPDVGYEEDTADTFRFTDPGQPEGSFRHMHVNNIASIEFVDMTTGKRAAAVYHTTMLRELEHRTTRDAVAAALWDRRWRESVIGQTAAPKE